MFIKGGKTSQIVNDAMVDLVWLLEETSLLTPSRAIWRSRIQSGIAVKRPIESSHSKIVLVLNSIPTDRMLPSSCSEATPRNAHTISPLAAYLIITFLIWWSSVWLSLFLWKSLWRKRRATSHYCLQLAPNLASCWMEKLGRLKRSIRQLPTCLWVSLNMSHTQAHPRFLPWSHCGED